MFERKTHQIARWKMIYQSLNNINQLLFQEFKLES
jgi:hypothetical protein